MCCCIQCRDDNKTAAEDNTASAAAANQTHTTLAILLNKLPTVGAISNRRSEQYNNKAPALLQFCVQLFITALFPLLLSGRSKVKSQSGKGKTLYTEKERKNDYHHQNQIFNWLQLSWGAEERSTGANAQAEKDCFAIREEQNCRIADRAEQEREQTKRSAVKATLPLFPTNKSNTALIINNDVSPSVAAISIHDGCLLLLRFARLLRL